MRFQRSWSLALLVGGLGLAMLGCREAGPPKHVVKGKVSNGGKVIPVKVNEAQAGGRLRVWLKNTEAKVTDSWEAKIDYSDGTFVIAGGDGRGVPQGKYKIFVEWKDNYPMGEDLLKGKFSEANSKIVRDIPPPDGELNIDVSKPEG